MAEMIISMKNSSDTIRYRTCDLPACSTVPQPTVPPRAPIINPVPNLSDMLQDVTTIFK